MAGTLLAVPNVSEGRSAARIARLEVAFADSVSLLDRHSDPDHNRTVFTIAGEAGNLRKALVSGAGAAIETIDMSGHEGAHPAIGALDVCPVVWLDPADRERAQSVAVEVAEGIGALGVPVFLYGDVAGSPERVERAHFRNGGLAELRRRMETGGLRPDFGPTHPHRTGGATLVTARAPLAAFNVELDGGSLDVARAVAAALRESGGGLPGVRAIGLVLSNGRAQVSTNVHDPLAVSLDAVVGRVRDLAAPYGARPVEAEVVGLVPAGALAGYQSEVPIRDFDPSRQTIEGRLAGGS